MLDASSLLKNKLVRGAGRGMLTKANLIFFLLLGGLLFLGFLSLTWRVADPESVRVPRLDEEDIPAALVPKEEPSVMARAAVVAEGSKAAAAGDLLITASKAAEAAAALSKAALSSATVTAAGGGSGAVTELRKLLLSDASVIAVTRKLEALGYPVKIGGRWPSGLPYLVLEIKASKASWGTGLQLPLTMVNISALQVRLAT